jgi:L-rhamnose mutarotase
MVDTVTPSKRFITGYRTRLKGGNAAAYRTLHSRVPLIVEQKLRAAGVLRWSIWTDGDTVFRSIETRNDYAIGALVDASRDSAKQLQHVWTMDEEGQR